MIKLAPLLFAALLGLGSYLFSAWRTNRELDQKSVELADPELRPVIDRLARSVDIERLRVFLYEIDPVNGLASPDGRIFITRGFYRKYREGDISADELASVIAHELGHVALGHTRRRMIDFSGQNALRTAAAMVLSRFIPGIGPWIAGLLTNMLAARMSRSDEFEADAYAAALLTKSGIGTAAQKSLLAKLGSLTGNAGASVPAWFLSHPKSEQRIAAIETLERRWGTLDA